MRLYIDVATQKLVEVAGSRRPITSVAFKRGDSARIEIQFVDGTNGQELSGTSITGVFGLKEAGKYDTGTYVVSDLAWTKEGTGASTLYVFEPDFNTTALNTLLASGDGDDTNDVASVTLMGEISWTIDGAIASTQKFDAVVYNDIIKGGEGTSGSAPVFGTTAPTNEAAATLTTGTSNAAVTWTAATAGTAGNDITVVTTDAAASAVTAAAEVGDAVTITRAAKARMQYVDGADDSGVLVWTGEDPTALTSTVYTTDGTTVPPGTGTWWAVVKSSGVWNAMQYIDGVQTILVAATGAGDFPDDASWATATLTAFSSSASQVKDAGDASLTIVDATLPGTGADTFAAVDPAEALTGGLDTTATPPHIRVASGNLYIQEVGVWKQVALSALS